MLCQLMKATVLPVPHLLTRVNVPPTASHQGRHLIRERRRAEMHGSSPMNGTVEAANAVMPPLRKPTFPSPALIIIMVLNQLRPSCFDR